MKPREQQPRLLAVLLLRVLALCTAVAVSGLAYPKQPEKCLDGGGKRYLASVPASNDESRIHGSLVASAAFDEGRASHGFRIEDHGDFKLVHVHATREVYCLHKAGSAPPPHSQLPAGTKVFSVPLVSVSVVDASAVAFMAELGVLHHIKYVTDMASDPCMRKLALPKHRSGCGRKSAGAAGSALLKEQAAEVGAVWLEAGSTPAADHLPGNSILFGAGAEVDPLGRAKWLEFVALFFGREGNASERLGTIVSSYRDVREAVAQHVEGSGAGRPRVAWAAASRPGEVELLLGPYEARLTQDAGGEVVELSAVAAAAAAAGAQLRCLGPGNGHRHAHAAGCEPAATVAALNTSTPEGVSALLRLLREVDVVVDTTPWPTASRPTTADLLAAYALPPEAAAAIPAFARGRVFRPDGHLAPPSTAPGAPARALEWESTAAPRPDLALQELAMALHPSRLPTETAPVLLRRTAPQRRSGAAAGGLHPQECVLMDGCTMAPQPPCPYIFRESASGRLRYSTAAHCGVPAAPTSLLPAAAAPSVLAATSSNASAGGATDNGAAALRPLLLVFLMIVALIEGLIHLF